MTSADLNLVQVTEEVFFSQDEITTLGPASLEFLKAAASRNARKRARIAAHRDVESGVHEMLIVLAPGCYIQPHKHLKTDESYHVVEGRLDALVFAEDGSIREVVRMAPYGSEQPFFYRLAAGNYHMPRAQSEFVVYHETLGGPFRREDSVRAAWAPDETEDPATIGRYLEGLGR